MLDRLIITEDCSLSFNMNPILISEKYESRPVKFTGLWEENGWKFKIYAITHKKNTIADEKTLNIAKVFAKKCTSRFRELAPAYGLGYIILHKGMNCNFIVVCFWVGENMIRTHSMISTIEKPNEYTEITETGMNVCVWDAEIHNFERNSWVENILSYPDNPNEDKYIQSVFKGAI
ncbi:MAG: hypothetical protein ABI543_03925 [Ignavibacteria bacterium]